MILTETQLNKIYDILVEYCGTNPKLYEREEFVLEHLKNDYPNELRNCPKLGFGGKFWRNNGRIYVSYYSENETPELEEIKNKVNLMLSDIIK
jgi:hypothetical protein